MRVVFLSPGWPAEMPQYVRGLAGCGAEVLGVGDAPFAALPALARRHLSEYLQVPAVLNEDDVIRRVEAWLGPRGADRVEALWEPVGMLAARMRQRSGLPGMRPDAVRGFRDKPLMKARVAAAGVAVPESRRAKTLLQVLQALEVVGYPAIVKPVAGAGSADTFRIDDLAGVDRVMDRLRDVPEVSVEAFVQGQEYTTETLCVDGRPVFRSVSMYIPNTLEARQNEWISPIIATFRTPPPEARPGLQMSDRALAALGMTTGLTHMEWFHTPAGRAIFGEIACRPPGANMVDLMNFAGDIDLYGAWAQAVVHGAAELPVERPYHAAIIFKRAQGRGRIRAIEGLDAFMRRYGRHVARLDLLPVGHPRRDWKQTFLSDGNLVVRHPDWEATLQMAKAAAVGIRMYAG